MQIIDIALLDVISLQYQPRAIVASVMYILLGYHFGQFFKDSIASEVENNSQFLNDGYAYNDLFSDFLAQSFGFQIAELLPTIQYISSFMALPFNYDLPLITGEQSNVFLFCIHFVGAL